MLFSMLQIYIINKTKETKMVNIQKSKIADFSQVKREELSLFLFDKLITFYDDDFFLDKIVEIEDDRIFTKTKNRNCKIVNTLQNIPLCN